MAADEDDGTEAVFVFSGGSGFGRELCPRLLGGRPLGGMANG